MKLVIPMAGKGTRLRPHTHVTPKPLMPVIGKSMVERIVETFIEVLPKKLEDAVFVLGDFPPEVKAELTDICERHDIRAHFGYQEKALGTAHAVSCVSEHLEGELVVVFADTLFYMDPGIELDTDGVVWVKHVEDPSRFGVVLKENGKVTGFVEKPKELISTEAIIGIYYVRDGAALRDSIKHLIENDLAGPRGEFEITDAFDQMLKQGHVFKTEPVREWLDCGTIDALMDTTRIILEKDGEAKKDGAAVDATLIEPVYLGEGARVERSVVGPYVVVEDGAAVTDSVVRNSIIFEHAGVSNAVLDDSLIGRHARVNGRAQQLNIGDHAETGERE